MEEYMKIFDWEDARHLLKTMIPKLFEEQETLNNETVIGKITDEHKRMLSENGFNDKGREAEDVITMMTEDIYPYRMKTSHGGYYCFMQNEISPYSVIGDLINSIYNPYAAGIQLSEGTAAIEESTLKFLASTIGYDQEKAGGQFVSGGSVGNMTALMMAREDKVSCEDYFKAVIYTSKQTHSSVKKSARLIGYPVSKIQLIDVNDDYQMDTEMLRAQIEKDLHAGLVPCCVIASCGTTNTGAIDPLHAIADICDEYNLWFHVDGAYGASVVMSSYKHLAAGIERSDSVCWDGHKWLYQTFGSSMFLCRSKAKMMRTFHTNPEYLHDVESHEEINYWDLGIEMTRPGRGMKLWFTLQVLGLDVIKQGIDYGIQQAEWMQSMIEEDECFEVLSNASLGLLNFRYVDSRFDEEALNVINHRLSELSLEENERVFLTTTLKEKTSLRFCVKSPMTSKDDLRLVIEDIRRNAKLIVDEQLAVKDAV